MRFHWLCVPRTDHCDGTILAAPAQPAQTAGRWTQSIRRPTEGAPAQCDNPAMRAQLLTLPAFVIALLLVAAWSLTVGAYPVTLHEAWGALLNRLGAGAGSAAVSG